MRSGNLLGSGLYPVFIQVLKISTDGDATKIYVISFKLDWRRIIEIGVIFWQFKAYWYTFEFAGDDWKSRKQTFSHLICATVVYFCNRNKQCYIEAFIQILSYKLLHLKILCPLETIIRPLCTWNSSINTAEWSYLIIMQECWDLYFISILKAFCHLQEESPGTGSSSSTSMYKWGHTVRED